jgi:hypothetical protein
LWKKALREIVSRRLVVVDENKLNSGGSMIKRYYPWIFMLAVFTALMSAIPLLRPSEAKAPPQQYPIMDGVANKIILKYQQSSCEQLWIKKSEKTPPTVEEQKAVAFLKSDPQMRVAFINKIAAPIANKMFDCGMIP